MNDRKQENLDRINDLWRLHRHWDAASDNNGRCVAFVIDKRYIDGLEGVEYRLGVSFGHNVVSLETRQWLIGIPVHPGKFIFGFHLIGIKGNQVTLYDKWTDARDAGDSADPVQGEAGARAILESISDMDYIGWVAMDGCKGPVKVSGLHLLEDFEVVEGEPWQGGGKR